MYVTYTIISTGVREKTDDRTSPSLLCDPKDDGTDTETTFINLDLAHFVIDQHSQDFDKVKWP